MLRWACSTSHESAVNAKTETPGRHNVLDPELFAEFGLPRSSPSEKTRPPVVDRLSSADTAHPGWGAEGSVVLGVEQVRTGLGVEEDHPVVIDHHLQLLTLAGT